MTYRIRFQKCDHSQILEIRSTSPCIVGRSLTADVVLSDPSVSRRHARLYHHEGRLHIEDLQSTNGVLVNGIPVQRSPLSPWDIVLLGNCVMHLEKTDGLIRESAVV